GGGGGLGGAGQGVFQLPEGIDELVGFDLTSSLIVRGDPDAIEELRELIAMLDVPPKQIEVESRFVNLTVSEARALGVNWTISNGSMTVEGSTPTSGGASVAVEYVTGNAQALMTAIQRDNIGKVVNAPRVSTQNGQPAIVAFQQDIPVTVSQVVTTDAASTVTTQIIPVPVTTALLVVPRVTGAPPNESVTTIISPQIEDVIGFVDNPSGGTIPITSTQQIQTQLRVPNGETIALGGLIRKNNSNDTIRIPLLGDLPIIGQLFRSHRVNVDESELIVFVTPSIIRDPTVTEGPVAVQ
ncbi:MAG: type II secretion system protein GspD, partial [Rubrivivax sp.]|nr:type II secretion system protein GspD [Rubrivivax sp.]